MKLKKLLMLSLAAALLFGGVITAHAAELDTAWYAEKNPDVVAEFGDSPEALRMHYEMYGKKEARMANSHDVEAQLRRLFKAEEYGTLYPDVKEFYGEDAEAMFQHYLSYGLLEARRPSEKVSQAVATSLKVTVEKAMTDAGLAAVPGSNDIAAVIESAVSAGTGGAEAAEALTQVSTVVEKAVAEAYEEVTNPKPAPSSGSSSSSSSSGEEGGSGSDEKPKECDPGTHKWEADKEKYYIYVCTECGKICDDITHDWDYDNDKCKICGFKCEHIDYKGPDEKTGDCICELCGKTFKADENN